MNGMLKVAPPPPRPLVLLVPHPPHHKVPLPHSESLGASPPRPWAEPRWGV